MHLKKKKKPVFISNFSQKYNFSSKVAHEKEKKKTNCYRMIIIDSLIISANRRTLCNSRNLDYSWKFFMMLAAKIIGNHCFVIGWKEFYSIILVLRHSALVRCIVLFPSLHCQYHYWSYTIIGKRSNEYYNHRFKFRIQNKYRYTYICAIWQYFR